MAFTNSNKVQVHKPNWEWLRFFPAATPALSALATIESTDPKNNRYIYAISASTFWQYDTYSDTWQQLAAPPTAPATVLTMRYNPTGRFWGRVIACPSSTTITIPGYRSGRLIGETVRIVEGTGRGQDRVISSAADIVINDNGVCTTAAANSIADSTKKWNYNQWAGYHCKLVFSTGQTQYRKVLYNDTTTLYFSDTNWQPYTPKYNRGFSATAPYALPITTAGSQTHYTIESQIITVPAWDTNPDSTSQFAVLTGSIYLISSATATPFYTFQEYDIASDVWVSRTAVGGLLPAALGTDVCCQVTGEYSGTFDTGTATVTGSGVRTLGDTTKSGTWTTDCWRNYEVYITGGTGRGQSRRIVANTTTSMEVATLWDTTPDATSTYSIYGNRDSIFLFGNGSAAIYKHHLRGDLMIQGSAFDYGIASNMAVKISGFEAFAVSTGARNTGGIKTVASAPTAGGTGYTVGDILTCNATGSNGQVIVTATDTNGIVTAVKLVRCGSGYTTGTGKTTTGGTGTSCTINITATGTIGYVTTAINHAIRTGDSIVFSGDALWAGTYTVLGVPSLTTLEFEITAAGVASAASSNGANLLVDASANWTVNEHVGKIVSINLVGITGAAVTRRITANTATTISFTLAATAPVNGTGRYIIYDIMAFGRAVQYKNPLLTNTGYATGGTSGTLVDTTKAWMGNQWAGYKLRVQAGTGLAYNDVTITSNTSTTLTLSSPGFTADTTTKYIIMDTFGQATTVTNTTNAVVTDTTKVWAVNMWAGKRLRITSGTGYGQEISITSNTENALTCTGVFTVSPLANASTYTIVDVPVRSTGFDTSWLFGSTMDKGKYIIVPRGGGSNAFDRYNIPNETWDLTYVCLPQSETFTTGSMYAYDGGDMIYIQKDATGRIYRMNTVTGTIEGAGMVPYAIGTAGIGVAVIGNRMEIVKTADGLNYLYILKHTGAALSATGGGTEFFRNLIFW